MNDDTKEASKLLGVIFLALVLLVGVQTFTRAPVYSSNNGFKPAPFSGGGTTASPTTTGTPSPSFGVGSVSAGPTGSPTPSLTVVSPSIKPTVTQNPPSSSGGGNHGGSTGGDVTISPSSTPRPSPTARTSVTASPSGADLPPLPSQAATPTTVLGSGEARVTLKPTIPPVKTSGLVGSVTQSGFNSSLVMIALFSIALVFLVIQRFAKQQKPEE